jgi:hypothetical protein
MSDCVILSSLKARNIATSKLREIAVCGVRCPRLPACASPSSQVVHWIPTGGTGQRERSAIEMAEGNVREREIIGVYLENERK